MSPLSKTFGTCIRTIPHLLRPTAYALRRDLSMAWRCSGTSNSELIENMWRSKLIHDAQVKAAFLKVDRANYAPSSPYEDSPQAIGHGATISAPHMHASAIEHVLSYLRPKDGDTSPRRVLDVGSGSGYLTHVLAELIEDGNGGIVVGVENIAALRDLGEGNMRRSARGKELLEQGKVRFRLGDGRKGWEEQDETNGGKIGGSGAWDVIHVGASAKELHAELVDQLKAPGCMFIPVDDDSRGFDQSVWKIEKDEQGQVKKTKLFGVRYVPLTDAPKT